MDFIEIRQCLSVLEGIISKVHKFLVIKYFTAIGN